MARRNRSKDAALTAFRSLEADRQRFERNGLGPGDGYLGLWRLFHDDYDLIYALRKKLTGEAVKGEERAFMISRHDTSMARAIDTLYKITAFERPKMRAKEAPPDQVPYDRVPPDLTKLTCAELDALEKMVLKVSGGRSDTTTPARRS
jgi:hypothetical protein